MAARDDAPPAGRPPRYAQVAGRLQAAIADGAYPVGTLLPTETELCERFEVSRHTVREALRALRELGLITRRQGSGTQVIAERVSAVFSQSLGSVEDVLQYARDTYLEVVGQTRVRVRGEQARTIGCTPGREWLRLTGIRRSGEGELPICLTEIYIDPAYAGIAPRVGQQGVAVYQLIEDHYGVRVHEIEQTISAVALDEAEAADLLCGWPAPGLRIVRRYLGQSGVPVEASVSVHPGDRFGYEMRIRRELGGNPVPTTP